MVYKSKRLPSFEKSLRNNLKTHTFLPILNFLLDFFLVYLKKNIMKSAETSTWNS